MMVKLKLFIACRMPEALLQGMDELVQKGFYENRSQAVRAAVVQLLRQTVWQPREEQASSTPTNIPFERMEVEES